MKLLLHNYRRCPFCIRVRMLLVLQQIPHELVFEPLRKWTSWMLQQKERGEKPRVPALQMVHEDGTEEVLFESNEINLFLDAQFGDRRFTPDAESDAYKDMLDWWAWCAETLKPQIDLYKYGENREFDAEKNIVHAQELENSLMKLEQALSGNYLLGNDMTLADMAIIPFVRQIMRTRNGEFSFGRLPNVHAWAMHVLEQAWFADEVMKKEVK